MTLRAVADTGPLVAILRAREEAHARCVAALPKLRKPLLTCWPVITEAAWLLQNEPGGLRALGRMVESGALKIIPLDDVALTWMIAFIERYATVGAQLADAAVMYLAESEGVDAVFTLDRRDFSIYRRFDGNAVTIVPDLGPA